MSVSTTLKTAALAAVLIVATAGSAFAAQWAWVDHDAKVKKNPQTISQTVNWVHEGQKVRIIAHQGSWVKLQIPGPDGWVRTNVIDWNWNNNWNDNNWPNNHWPNHGPSGQVCFSGPNGYVCLGN